ncbi:alpha/beta hydrolase family protein [Massilia rhizosphaerae]|uniref:alpha/beta hydrolase family protein n=1 Tax=Massilia rhizosphaerae TaxID=2784389 RepID=UPI0018DC80B6|nr:alpha/beta fold hydrolase [Massilia rhizosphaerae]
MNRLSTLLLSLLAALPLPAAHAGVQPVERPSVESFFRHPDVGFVRLSPSGRYVALLNRLDGGHQALVVRETADPTKVNTVATFESARLQDLEWVNDDRLTLTLKDVRIEFEGNYDQFAVDRDGTHLTHLISGNWNHEQQTLGTLIKDRVLTADYIFEGVTHDGSDDIVVGKLSWNNVDLQPQSVHPFRLNTRTRVLTDMVVGPQPEHVRWWLLDASDRPRLAVTEGKGRCVVYYRAEAAGPWDEISNRDCLEDDAFRPLMFDDRNTLYVRAGYKERTALFAFDLAKKTLDKQPFVDIDGFDFDGDLERDYGSKKILGVRFQADAASTVWLDPTMKAIQKKVDALLPGTINRVSCPRDCRNPPAVVITAESDRMPPAYFLYTPSDGHIVGFGSSHPDIQPKQMGKRDFFHYAARDGLQIPIYVTTPPGKADGPRPAIVLVHGGPYVRGGSWEWDAEAQFLASRGYVVLQPEFRGSTGFGSKLFRAGWQQWGRTMQDDLADAAAWAVKQGWADPKRIGIMGASYGGYATLMGLVRNPDIFRAGVEWAGVTDIGLLFTAVESDASEDLRRYGLKTLIGDPLKDPAAFAAVSPLEQAGRIHQPLLMAHGAQDRRVPIVHAAKMHDAIQAKNANVEYVVYPEEGHGWRHEEDSIDFWKRVEAFLDKNLAH